MKFEQADHFTNDLHLQIKRNSDNPTPQNNDSDAN